MATPADQRPSEYGGRPGLVQRAEDGHLPDVAERAYLLRASVNPSPRWVDGTMTYDELPAAVDVGQQLA